MTLKQEYKLGPDYWHSCALTASEAVVDSDQDGISDEKIIVLIFTILTKKMVMGIR